MEVSEKVAEVRHREMQYKQVFFPFLGREFLLVCLLLSGTTPSLQGQVSKQILEGARIEPQIGQSLPMAADFRDHSGNTVRLGEVVSKRPSVLCLVYFDCPMLCKVAADGLIRTVASLPETVGKDFDVVLASFDPHDTAARADAARTQALKKYARENLRPAGTF